MNTDSFVATLREFAGEAFRNAQELPQDRNELLTAAAGDIADLLAAQSTANLLFVCTHNSRRSQFSQLWATAAVHYFDVEGVACFSCGTEATACNIRTVESLRRAGVEISTQATVVENPRYRCTFQTAGSESNGNGSVELYSKAFGHPSLPTENIVAMMCCDDADAKCPVVPGAKYRVPLHYLDPKSADGSPQQDEIYDRRSRQIAAEMFYMIQKIRVG